MTHRYAAIAALSVLVLVGAAEPVTTGGGQRDAFGRGRAAPETYDPSGDRSPALPTRCGCAGGREPP